MVCATNYKNNFENYGYEWKVEVENLAMIYDSSNYAKFMIYL